MTETEWVTCSDPLLMLRFLDGKASDRKLRLFGCACCRSVWEALTDERSRRAVETAERYADGVANRSELRAARKAAEAVANHDASWWRVFTAVLLMDDWYPPGGWDPVEAAPFFVAAKNVGQNVAHVASGLWGARGDQQWQEVSRDQANLLRDVLGNPFRPVSLARAWLTPQVISLAQSLYVERASDRLPLLADALEVAGCHDAGILSHSRGPRPHVRGCWVVDLIMGKK